MAQISVTYDVTAFANFWQVAAHALAFLKDPHVISPEISFEFNGVIVNVESSDTEQTLWEKYQNSSRSTMPPPC